MTVQDLVITAVVLLFVVSAVPMLFDEYTPPYRTSVLMTVGALALAITYSTLGLWFSFTVEIAAAVVWGLLVLQRARSPRPEALEPVAPPG